MASTSILSRTLNSITGTKLDEISKQREKFESNKASLLAKVDAENDPCERVSVLLESFPGFPSASEQGLPNRSRAPIENEANLATSRTNMKQFVAQARQDPSVSEVQLKDWESKLRKELDVQSLKYEYASLYGQLVNEWLADPSSDKKAEGETEKVVVRKEKLEQRDTWEGYVFEALDIDTKALESYLDGIFDSSKEIKEALKDMREMITMKGDSIAIKKITTDDLDWCIKGLLRSDLLTDEKRAVLQDFRRNKVVLNEIVDVLNMRLASLDTWTWGKEGVPVEQRRHLNGRYRFYQDEDLLQLIFLRYIGVQWSVIFKEQFTHFRDAIGSWSSPGETKLTKEQRKRVAYFLNGVGRNSVSIKRENIYNEEIFLEQLQSKVDSVRAGYDDDSQSEDDTKHLKSSQEITQTVIRLLASEIAIQTRFGNDISVVRSDFKWFGPSLPHNTMFTVLKYFGVPEKWLSFFKHALEVPIQFVEDGPDSPVRIRKRGTLISGPISDVLGETVLFCLDFAFNQKTGGATTLYRLHDDIWFWGSKEACEKGWEVLTEFTALTGLEVSEEKTGSVEIRSSSSEASEKSSKLPTGPVIWGFLQLSDEGRFVIDQSSVKKHIDELQLQLSACTSVFDYIQAWNIYATRFFTVNFGKPCNAFGSAHIDEILSTFQDIQHSLFGPQGSVTSNVKSMLTDRFGVTDIPEGYLYFPLDMGGLDLKSPFVAPYLVRDGVKNPSRILDEFLREEEKMYNRLRTSFEDPDLAHTRSNREKPYDADTFMSFEEFKSYRYVINGSLGGAFDQLMSEPKEFNVQATKEVLAALGQAKWNGLEGYWRWITALHGNDMIQRFGGLNVVDKGLLPIGMVGMFRQSRFQWQG